LKQLNYSIIISIVLFKAFELGSLNKEPILLLYRKISGLYYIFSKIGSFVVLDICGDRQCFQQILPVCGTDGKSYLNECFLEKEACKSGTEIKVFHRGLCQGKFSF